MAGQGWSPSGSRWEPVPTDGAVLAPAGRASGEEVAPGRRNRRRGPVLVLLVALLGLGGVSAGVAHEQAPASGASPAAGAGSDGSGPAPAGGRGSRPHHGRDARGTDLGGTR